MACACQHISHTAKAQARAAEKQAAEKKAAAVQAHAAEKQAEEKAAKERAEAEEQAGKKPTAAAGSEGATKRTAEVAQTTDSGAVAGLATLLEGCGLLERLADAESWCLEQGVETVQDILEAEFEQAFAMHLQLKPAKQAILIKRLKAL